MQDKLYKLMDWRFIESVVYTEEDDPHRQLGVHKIGRNLVFQTFQPDAVSVNILLQGEDTALPMEMMDEAGYFAAAIPNRKINGYRYEVCYDDGTKKTKEDAYRFGGQITTQDTDKFKAGVHYTIYNKLGAHLTEIDGVKGCTFAVWAPNAVRVSVVGNFNAWDGREHQMRRLSDSGVFEIFIPEVKAGDYYKFELKIKGGQTYLKADPYAFGTEHANNAAGVVRDIRGFTWHDADWLRERKEKQAENTPLNIYEVWLGSFTKPGKKKDDAPLPLTYREMAKELVPYVKKMGYTHVELMPVMEHAVDDAYGYETYSYYAPASRYGTPEDLQVLIDSLHQEKIGVILDWVPGWFPKNSGGLSHFDGTCLYEHLDDRKKNHPFRNVNLYNYGRNEVKNYLIANAMFWVDKYHADGIRMISVDSMLYLDYGKEAGQWIPNGYGGHENLEAVELIKHLNSIMKIENPGVLMIAEDYSTWDGVTRALKDGGLGFDYKWNAHWTADYLEYIQYDPYFRSYHQGELTHSIRYAYNEKFILPFGHDEVEGSLYQIMPGEEEAKLAGLRLTYAYQMTQPGKKLSYRGEEAGAQEMVRELNHLYLAHPALYEDDHRAAGFRWVDGVDHENCKITYIRRSRKGTEKLLIVCNFAGIDREILIGVPDMGKYKEIFNTDEERFGGTGYTNPRARNASAKKADGCRQSIKIKMAALGISIWQVMKA